MTGSLAWETDQMHMANFHVVRKPLEKKGGRCTTMKDFKLTMWVRTGFIQSVGRHLSPQGYRRHAVSMMERFNNHELYTILLAARRWGNQWQNSKVVVYTDKKKKAPQSWVNKLSLKNRLMNGLVWLSVTRNCFLGAKWIITHRNATADALSRFD